MKKISSSVCFGCFGLFLDLLSEDEEEEKTLIFALPKGSSSSSIIYIIQNV